MVLESAFLAIFFLAMDKEALVADYARGVGRHVLRDVGLRRNVQDLV